VNAVAGGEDDDRQLAAFAAQGAQDLEAVAAPQSDVEDQQLVAVGSREPQDVFAVGGDDGCEAVCAQSFVEEGRDACFVFGDQDSAHRRSLSFGDWLVGREHERERRSGARPAGELDVAVVGFGRSP